MKIPFSVYDFFGYLASGFLLLAAVDFAFEGGWLLRQDLGAVFGLLWTAVAYIAGHINANIAGYVLERRFVRDILGSPEERLFGKGNVTRWSGLFPGYFEALPDATQQRVLDQAGERAGI